MGLVHSETNHLLCHKLELLAKVKNKAWFGFQASVRDLLSTWTIQQQALLALKSSVDRAVNKKVISGFGGSLQYAISIYVFIHFHLAFRRFKLT